MPIDYGHQINKSMLHADVGNISTPDLIATLYLDIPQQIRKYLMLRIDLSEFRLGVHRFQSHLL